MKRFLCALFAALLLIPVAFAEGLDLSGMSVEELRALRDQIDKELANRAVDSDEIVVYESADARVVLNSCEHVPAYLGERDKYVIYVEWTNMSQKSAALDQFLNIEIFANGEQLEKSEYKTDTAIRPQTTMEATVSAYFSLMAKTIEVVFMSADGETEYYVYTINRE